MGIDVVATAVLMFMGSLVVTEMDKADKNLELRVAQLEMQLAATTEEAQ